MSPSGQLLSQDFSLGLSAGWLSLSRERVGGDGEDGGASDEVLGKEGWKMSQPLLSSNSLCVSLDLFVPVFVPSLLDSVSLSLSCVFDPVRQPPGLGVEMLVTQEPLTSPSPRPSMRIKGC